ncbi:GGDEF domain-containing protein [Thalassotalea sp. G2M2-11]|uniref:GGDEF domain-containing protein n=1 Tax=Thalassotalea sp. G2M2-11 TaxID=2787627 RepID=UPI0019D06170|nr:GGDEF domain-containing protein [Thalassotalea sp. G2M2-11]
MANNATADRELIALKRKLDCAIESRSTIDEQLKHQNTLFTEFIIKLSQTCKGIDIALDNKLAKLRTLFVKSASIDEVEKLTKEISLQLQKFSSKNDHEISQLRQQFSSAGTALQKVNGLPAELRRNLRSLLKENEQSKDALSQYVPLLSDLVGFYQAALKQGNIAQNGNGISNNNAPTSQPPVANQHVILRFSEFLSKIHVSKKHESKLKKIKLELKENMPNDKLLNSFLAAFDLLSNDLLQEQNTAKRFLSTLSETLTTVQTAVTSTLNVQEKNKEQHQKLNIRLQSQIDDMSTNLEQANSLVDIKVDINSKLKAIAATINEKSTIEHDQQCELERKLVDMQTKVNTLEQQSKQFEKRIHEQHVKSLQDALTKLYNRAAFDEHFAKEIVRCQHNHTPLALVVADLDNFKRINDTYGHTAGDKTLQVIANTFKKYLDDCFIARYGGEEFVFVFADLDKNTLLKKLNTLKLKVAKLPFKFKNNKVSMTLSIGVTFIQPDDNVHIAFERADTALYQAKKQGKDKVIYIE